MKDKIEKAEQLGRNAFNEGQKFIFTQDVTLRPIVKGITIHEATAIHKSWQYGWLMEKECGERR